MPGDDSVELLARTGLRYAANRPMTVSITRLAYRFATGLAALAISCVALATPASSGLNYEGLWWNAPPGSESGWGINLAHQGDAIFVTWFTYDGGGRASWLSMTANRTAQGTYSGTLIRTTGPASSANPFDPAKVIRTEVGSGALTFPDADSGTLLYTLNGVSQTKFITRLVFGPMPSCTYEAQPNLVAATNYQDLWWAADGAESGWGVNLTHQGDVIFASWYTYAADGSPVWLTATAVKIAPNVYGGDLIRAAGPAFDAVPFEPGKVTRTVVGTTTLTFAHGNAAAFAYTIDGLSESKRITRQLFAPPAGTLCGEPYQAPIPVTIVAAGDIAQCGKGPAAASGAAQTAALVDAGVSLVLTLGDNAYDKGRAAEFANCFQPTWGAFKDRIRPSPGNHEYESSGADGYFTYFGAQAGPDRRGYYSFDYGSWHFISLNSQIDVTAGSEQYLWLLADLAMSRNSLCTIAYWHYPAFNSGAEHGSIEAMKPFFDAAYTAGVDIVLSGHEHIYERFAPQRADGTADPARGVREFVVGTGGAGLYAIGRPLPNSEFRNNATWGVLRLTLEQGRYSWRFVPVGGGDAIDSGTGTCHP